MLPRRIAFFGASSIYGTADTELGGFVNRFRLWYETIDAQRRVYNLGIWGEQSKSLLERIEVEAKPRRPQLILIYPGLNDCRREGSAEAENFVPLSEYGQLIRSLLTKATSVAETVIMTAYPLDETRTSPLAGTNSHYLLSDAKTYAKEILAAAEENPRASALDLLGILSQSDWQDFLAEDGLHFNAAGHQRLFEILKGCIEDRYTEDKP